jgi:hypothetical protein
MPGFIVLYKMSCKVRVLNKVQSDRGLPSRSDVNVDKTNSFLMLNFQFVSISKRNVLFYPYITLIKMIIKTNCSKTQEKHENQTKRKVVLSLKS